MVTLALPVLAGCGTTQGRAVETVRAPSAAEGCSAKVEPIDESPSFTPYERRLTHSPFPDDLAVRAVETPPLGLPDTLDGLAVVGASEAEHGAGSTVAYGGAAPKEGRSAFLRSGGLLVVLSPGVAGESVARDLAGDPLVADRIVQTTVGEHDAAVTWADPDESGLRPHHVLWTEPSGQEIDLVGVRAPEELVAIARDWVC
ncbi:hypothetical protein GCM10023350_16700 [Nocardioides endophyticus]|uniref:DUF4245 domain-containing protein n=1 Tax=Nocardioides endophyticus TaxID=1353775 RepID=A0ABP8YLL9_9ACTN